MSEVSRKAFTLHRWLAWAVGLQILIWVGSGIVFAWLPFETWVKGGAVLQRPPMAAPRLPPELSDWQAGDMRSLAAVATPQGTVWRLDLADGTRYVPMDGSPWVAPDAAAVQRFAQAHVKGTAAVVDIQRLSEVPRRLGIVDEVGGRAPVWRVRFDDALGTRIYLDGESGAFIALRNEAWVGYDFLWRLHIMDYVGGEDFNNSLLRTAATAAAVMVGAGALLSLWAARRAGRRRARRARPGGGAQAPG